MQPLDGVGGASALPLAWRQASKGEEAVAGFLQTIGDGTVLEPPFADEGLAAGLDLLTCRGVDHIGVVGADLLVQTVGCMRQQVPMLVNRAALDGHVVPDGRNRLIAPRRTVANYGLRPSQTARAEIIGEGAPSPGALPAPA